MIKFPKPAKKARRSKSSMDRDVMGAVASQGCALCLHLGYGATPSEIHHRRDNVGAGQRSSHIDVIGLCPEHHRGNSGYHGLGRKAFEREYGVTEYELHAIYTQPIIDKLTNIS